MRGMIYFAAKIGIWSLLPVFLQAKTSPTDLDQIQHALGIPASIAKVTDGVLAAGEKLPEFLLVQDVHRHPEVQGNIAALVLYGSHHWGLQDVYLEGAEAGARVGIFPERSTGSLREAVQSGLLSGAEMAAALEPDSPLELRGLEDPELYRENVEAYEHSERLREPALRELNTAQFIRKSLDLETDILSDEEKARLIKMLELRLKPADHASFEKNPYAAPGSSELNEAIQAAETFYALADQRSAAFLKNAQFPSRGAPRLLVVGGFHTEKMASLLRREGRSFAILSPHITQTGYDGLYARGMRQTISALKLH